MAELRILPPAAKYFKKLKDKQLKRLFQEAIDEIMEVSTIIAGVIYCQRFSYVQYLHRFSL